MSDNENFIEVRVWDLSLRVFHWLLVVLITVMFVSAKTGNFDIHVLAGKTLVILIIARIGWGLFGSSNARFSSWLFAPGQYIDYIRALPRREPSYSLAHSPIGSLAAFVILAGVIFQISTGLVASDVDGLVEGPFAYYVSYDLSRWAGDTHVIFEQYVLILIGAHIAANLFYLIYKKDNLIAPMVTGLRLLPREKVESSPHLAPAWKGALTLLISAALMLWIFITYG